MVTFVCPGCRFKYAPRAATRNPPNKCPNCGKTAMKVEPTAQDILDSINTDMFGLGTGKF